MSSDPTKDCFVIMPISTPVGTSAQHGDDEDHFRHVLDHLFLPAIEQAGFNMIPPSFAGSELIPAEIVAQLEKSSLVLCDISSLNPNVFLELGIRIALNKPVAMVKDRHTDRIPFDTAAVGHYTYDESLTPWTLEDQITGLTEHIKQVANSGDQNALWKYFGMRLQAGAPTGEEGVSGQLGFIMDRLDQLSERFDSPSPSARQRVPTPVHKIEELIEYLTLVLGSRVGGFDTSAVEFGILKASVTSRLSRGLQYELGKVAVERFGIALNITYDETSDETEGGGNSAEAP
ncbi:MAG: hypothetical protein IH872_12550 [Chloroflexi bacterium]|nr:hypothetical protein [Chloroflexota bacterium]